MSLKKLFNSLHSYVQFEGGEYSRVADAICKHQREINESVNNSRADLSTRDTAILVCRAITGFKYDTVEACFRNAGIWNFETETRRVETLLGAGGRRRVKTDFPFPGLNDSLEQYLDSLARWTNDRSKDTLKYLVIGCGGIPAFVKDHWSKLSPMCQGSECHQKVWVLFFARFFPRLRDSQIQSLVESATQTRREAADRAFASIPPVPMTPPPLTIQVPKVVVTPPKVDPPLRSDCLRMLSAANTLLERPKVEYFSEDPLTDEIRDEIRSELAVVRLITTQKTKDALAAMKQASQYKNAYLSIRSDLKKRELEVESLKDKVCRLKAELETQDVGIQESVQRDDRMFEKIKSAYQSLQDCMLISTLKRKRSPCEDSKVFKKLKSGVTELL